MKMPKLTKFKSLGKAFVFVKKPEFLFGVSVASTLSAVVLAGKGGYEARGIIDNHRAENPGEEITLSKHVELTWLCYMPSMAATVTSIGSTTGLHLVHVKEKKALAQMALAATDELKDEIERLNKQKDDILEVVTGDGEPLTIESADGEVEEWYLVRDAVSGRDFFSSERKIETALLEVHREMLNEGVCDLSYFYGRAGMASPPDASDLGWSGKVPEINWSGQVRADGRPVRQFSFQPKPSVGFDRHA